MGKSLDRLLRIESLLALASSGSREDRRAVMEALGDGDWQSVQAALHAVRWYPDADYVLAIDKVLAEQDALPVYGQADEIAYQAGTPFTSYPGPLGGVDGQTLTLWRCRWRVKQAGCLAVGAIAEVSGDAGLLPTVVERLCRYASDGKEDYQVRAAACRSLRWLKGEAVVEALRKAVDDEEWCTSCEARKSLEAVAS